MFRRRTLTEPVDYLNRRHDRRKLTNYLRTGRFKKIAGSRSVGGDAAAKRFWLFVASGVVLAVGLFHAIF